MNATLLDCCPRCGYVLDHPRLPPLPLSAPARPLVRAGVPRAHAGPGTAHRPQRRLGAQDPARPRRHLPARRRRDLPGRRLVLARHRRPHRRAGRAHRHHRAARPVAGPPRPRVAAEALTTVALGLLCLDLVGARDAGWLGAPTDDGSSRCSAAPCSWPRSGSACPPDGCSSPSSSRRSASPLLVAGAGSGTDHTQLVATVTTLGVRRAGRARPARCAPSCCPGSPSPARCRLPRPARPPPGATPPTTPPSAGSWLDGHGYGLLAVAALVAAALAAGPRPRRPPPARVRRVRDGADLRGRRCRSTTRAPPPSRSARPRPRSSGRSSRARLRRAGTPYRGRRSRAPSWPSSRCASGSPPGA